MPSIAAVAGQLQKADLPVLILDTCILLDIIRSTHRGLTDYAKHASNLLQLLSTTQPECSLVVASIVPHEWNKHAQEVTDETNSHYAKMEEQSSHFHDACQALNITVGFGRASYSKAGTAERLRDLSKQLLDHAIQLDDDDHTRGKAFHRVVHSIPPSRKGGQIQDCTITEEALTLSQTLTGNGFVKKRVFCTSNVNDYCEPGKKIHPVLAADFNAASLIFTTNLGWSIHEVTH